MLSTLYVIAIAILVVLIGHFMIKNLIISQDCSVFSTKYNDRDSELEKTLKQPQSRLDISQKIKDFATSCIDISDGLYSDLNHICKQSKVGARISLEQLPVHPKVKKNPQWTEFVLSGGDDYELCFTLNPKSLDKLPNNCTIIGQVECGQQVSIYSNNQKIDYNKKGFVHFSSVL